LDLDRLMDVVVVVRYGRFGFEHVAETVTNAEVVHLAHHVIEVRPAVDHHRGLLLGFAQFLVDQVPVTEDAHLDGRSIVSLVEQRFAHLPLLSRSSGEARMPRSATPRFDSV
jgi:hypothetical protein